MRSSLISNFLGLVCLQNVWAVLDLYGPVRSVSIVSSTRLEEPEGTQPPSPSSDTGSEGDEDDEDEEHGLGVRGCSRALWAHGRAVGGPLATRLFLGSPVLSRMGRSLCTEALNSSGGLGLALAALAAQSLLHTRARITCPLCLQPLNSWRTMGRISSCPMGTGQLRGWPATTRASLSSVSPWRPSCWSRWAFLVPFLSPATLAQGDPGPTFLEQGLSRLRTVKGMSLE